VKVPLKWTHKDLKRALNAVLPSDVRVRDAVPMCAQFHARFNATARTYRYLVGTDEEASSPFRSGRELAWHKPLDRALLDESASLIIGDKSFRGFAVRGTAPETDDHHCIVSRAEWVERDGGLAFVVTANRFLHHMVRFLIGTMLDVASGRRAISVIFELLDKEDNQLASAPAAPYGLYLERVEYPKDLYLVTA
jgi:tRNA pseudouridine38-40 synthase